MPYKYLFYISQNYSFEILRPLQQAMLAKGAQVKWLAIGDEVNCDNFAPDEQVLPTVAAAIDYQPDACFVPGNVIPDFIPGLKVQVFHGLEWKKKGHFVIRGYFDLYCTHGPATTQKFNQLAEKHGYFDVVETGWPKLDNLFNTAPFASNSSSDKKVILYAPTFSPALTSAPQLFEQIKILADKKDWHWLIKFHPKMKQSWVQQYKTLVNDNIEIVDEFNIASLLQVADVMVSDTSSVIGEFALLNKPIVSLNNSQPGDYLIDINNEQQLESAIEQALSPKEELKSSIKDYAQALHPYNDGSSSVRILDAVEARLINGKQAKKSKPWNLFRRFKLRKTHNYWRF